MGKSQKLYEEAKKYIPGGTQILSKRPEMFLPGHWPSYYKKAKGANVWDMDGNKYYDASYMGIGACMLGYADKDVNKAVENAVKKGNMSTLNSYEEVELAKILCKLHPWAQMVRYARTGGESMSVAVRIARAKTQKDIVLFSGYHGWHDWYLAANLSDDSALDGHLLPGLSPRGVPRALKGSSLPFKYGDTEAFLKLVKDNKGKIACVAMESFRNELPEENFIKTIRRICDEEGIVLIFDEITAGFRITHGGGHLAFGINPDIAVFAKGISNGHPMAAIIGKESVMQAAQESFISSTYWSERTGPAAAIATIEKMEKKNVSKHLIDVGVYVQEAYKKEAEKADLDIHVSGIPPLSHFSFNKEEKLKLKTLFTQIMLKEGFLATNAFYASYAHKEKDLKKYVKSVGIAFTKIKDAIDKGNVNKMLIGNVCHSGFKRLT